MDEMYHCCRWCKSYTGDGKCERDDFAEPDNAGSWVYRVDESGKLCGVLEESLGSVNRREFEDDLQRKLSEFGLSRKKIRDFMGAFNDSLTQFLDNQCKPMLADDIAFLYQNEEPSTMLNGIVIKNPEMFYCRYFE